MSLLPPPTTFAEGQRKLFGILMAIAGVAYGVAALAATAVIVWGAWPADLARLRLLLVGGAMAGATIGSIAVTLALAVGGPVGRFSVKASKAGAELSAEDHTSASVTTTATINTPASGGGNDPAAHP